MPARQKPQPSEGGNGRTAASRTPPATAQEALARARDHSRAALHEALAAVHDLMDAVSLGLNGEPSETSRWLGPIAARIEGLRSQLEGANDADAASLVRAIAGALDSEIARWEERADNDVEARSVLRAFLGLRELLWEFGVRREPEAEAGARPAPRKAGSAKRRRKPRVQRVPVEG